jgi:hypothetical protein
MDDLIDELTNEKQKQFVLRLLATDQTYSWEERRSLPFGDGISHCVSTDFANYFGNALRPESLVGSARSNTKKKIRRIQQVLDEGLKLQDVHITNLIEVSFLEDLYDINLLAFYILFEDVKEFPLLEYQLLAEVTIRVSRCLAVAISELHLTNIIQKYDFWHNDRLFSRLKTNHMPVQII